MTPGASSDGVVRDVVHVTHHLLLLVVNGRHPGADLPSAPNGLAGVGPACVAVYTGLSTGWVEVALERLDGAPPAAEGWDDVVEVSIAVDDGELRLATVMGDVPASLPALSAGPAVYRVRVHARGRDADPDGASSAEDRPLESYLVQSWPEQAERGDEVLSMASRYSGEVRLAASRAASRPGPPVAQMDPAEAEREARIRDILRGAGQPPRRPQ